MKIGLAPFTLIGATTRLGLLTTPLRDRFGIPVRLNFYTVEELEYIVRRGARILGVELTDDGATEIARRSRGTPALPRGSFAASAISPSSTGSPRSTRRKPTRRSAASRSIRSASISSTGAISS